jgi:hypothetical protein
MLEFRRTPFGHGKMVTKLAKLAVGLKTPDSHRIPRIKNRENASSVVDKPRPSLLPHKGECEPNKPA